MRTADGGRRMRTADGGRRTKKIIIEKIYMKNNKLIIEIVQKEVDRPTRLLKFAAFVHLPFSFRSLDLFVASLFFRKGTSFCVIRRK